MAFANVLRLGGCLAVQGDLEEEKFLGHFEEVAAIAGTAVLAPAGTGGRGHGDPDSGRHASRPTNGNWFWSRWWIGDALGVLIMTPVLLGLGKYAAGLAPRWRSKSDRQDDPAGRRRGGRMLLRLLPPRGLLSALLGVPVDPGFSGLGGTSRGPRQRPGDCIRRGVGDAHRRGSVRGRHRPGKPPEPEPVSGGRIADRSGGRGVPELRQPVAAWQRPGGGMGVERMAVRFARSGPGGLRRSSLRQGGDLGREPDARPPGEPTRTPSAVQPVSWPPRIIPIHRIGTAT